MTSPTLPFETLTGIFEHLPEEDAIEHYLIRTDLFNCSLVSHDWRAAALPMLWKTVRFVPGKAFRTYEDVSILSEQIWQRLADSLVSKCRNEAPCQLIASYIHSACSSVDKGIDEEGGRALAKALKMNRSLQNLDLWKSDVGENGASALAEALKTNTSLKNLDIKENGIGKDGASALAEVLKMNMSLQILDLGRNCIGDIGASALVESLKTNTSLQNLDLSLNNIGEKGARALAEALK
ncbi:hypothetical protein BC936DRAFT_144557, partial [Jimgerdemannia flammicorona]